MKLLVDGVFFQLNSTGITRVWSSILPRLASYPDLDIVLLDRGMSPSIDGIQRVEFPAYTFSNTAADSFLIDECCREFGVDVFTSTYFTTPITIPSVLLVYDMIPEVLGFDLSKRWWQEKQIAISFARYYACISSNTRADLKRFYPSISDDRAIVTHCGVDRDVFRPCAPAQIEDFKRRWAVTKRYYVLVGAREQHGGYKNTDLLFRAVRKFRECEIDILCIGGEPEVNPTALAGLPRNVSARRVELTDQDLACAYSGAEALIYPSLYEGFGMPVVEAMACGCPVITTRHGSLGEVSGEAAVFVSGHDADELRCAMALVRDANERKKLIERGLRRAARYSWDDTARGVYNLLERAREERYDPAMKDFFVQWKKLRAIQAEVDVGC
jgi:glycosyltransferase involved in cell wall biosynthesis